MKEYIINYYNRNIKNIYYLFICFNDINNIILFLNLYINKYIHLKDKYNNIYIQSINNIYLYNSKLLKMNYNFICILYLCLIYIYNYIVKFFLSLLSSYICSPFFLSFFFLNLILFFLCPSWCSFNLEISIFKTSLSS